MATRNHIDVPRGFWPFWIVYFDDGQRQRELEQYPCYRRFVDLLWKIHTAAEREESRQ